LFLLFLLAVGDDFLPYFSAVMSRENRRRRRLRRRPYLFGDMLLPFSRCYFIVLGLFFLSDRFACPCFWPFSNLGVRPPVPVDGRLDKMSRDSVAYLKGLCYFCIVLCSCFLLAFLLVHFTVFVDFVFCCSFLSWEAVSWRPGVHMF
jgi:hypothetical protein